MHPTYNSLLQQNITQGNLRVLTYPYIYTFPATNISTNAVESNPYLGLKAEEFCAVNDVFWNGLCTMSDLGFAEAYMYGGVECDNLVSTFLVSSLMLESCTTEEISLFKSQSSRICSHYPRDSHPRDS